MTLANYINDLLYRYDCVIVPNFGGFVTNKIGAKVNNFTHTFYPPSKQVSFNSHLKHNDGLLANYIATAQNSSFEKANEFINNSVAKWQQELEENAVTIASVGSLTLNSQKQVVFEPNTASNFLTEAFGLATVESPAIERFKQEVKPLNTVVKVAEEKSKKQIPAFIKYAATAAILLTLGITGYNKVKNNQQQELFAKQQQEVAQKIQQATFVIDTPLPTINLDVVTKNTNPYHVIAGAFQLEENALKKVTELQNKGYKAEVLGKNEWNLIQVSFGSYATDAEARNVLEKVRETEVSEAWLLVKKFN